MNSYPSLRENLETEILIVGGGITGSLIAHKRMADDYRTALIDKREIAHASTSAATSTLQYEIDVPLYELTDQIGKEGGVANYRGCFDAIDTQGQISKSVHSTCGFKKKDSLYFAAFKKDVPNLKKEFDARKAHGFPVTMVDTLLWRSIISSENRLGLETVLDF